MSVIIASISFFISSRPPCMNNRVCPVSGQPCLWQRPPAPTCKWWLHGCGTASRWKRYGRKAGQYNTPTCRAALFSARKAMYRSVSHCFICHKRRGRGVPFLPLSLLLSLSLSLSLTLSLVDECRTNVRLLSGAVKVPCFPALQPVFSRLR